MAGDEKQGPDALTKGALWLALVPVLLVGGCIAWASSGDSGSSAPDAYEAKAQCEGFVDKRLKAPADAKYDLEATKSGNTWTVTGTVDAENSFGAKLRNDVSCTLHFKGDTAYLDDISVG